MFFTITADVNSQVMAQDLILLVSELSTFKSDQVEIQFNDTSKSFFIEQVLKGISHLNCLIGFSFNSLESLTNTKLSNSLLNHFEQIFFYINLRNYDSDSFENLIKTIKKYDSSSSKITFSFSIPFERRSEIQSLVNLLEPYFLHSKNNFEINFKHFESERVLGTDLSKVKDTYHKLLHDKNFEKSMNINFKERNRDYFSKCVLYFTDSALYFVPQVYEPIKFINESFKIDPLTRESILLKANSFLSDQLMYSNGLHCKECHQLMNCSEKYVLKAMSELNFIDCPFPSKLVEF